jgi:hypothetical protein
MVSVLQTAFGGFSNEGGFFVFSTLPTAGNAIVVCVGGFDITNTLTMTAPTNSAHDSFSLLVSTSTTFPDAFGNTCYAQCQIWMATNIVGGSASHVIDINGTEPNNCGLTYCAYELQGLATSPLDATTFGSGTTFPAGSGVTLVPGASPTFALAFICPMISVVSTNINMAAGSGWTLDPNSNTSGHIFFTGGEEDVIGAGAQHQFLSSANPVSCALSASAPASGIGWLGCGVTLKGVGAIAGGPYPHWLSTQMRDSMRQQ